MLALGRLREPKVVGCRFAGTAVCHDLEGHLLTFAEISNPSPLNGADMDKHIAATGVRLNEAETLGRVEPLHCTHSHVKFSVGQKTGHTDRM
jgi:hypothetical protein